MFHEDTYLGQWHRYGLSLVCPLGVCKETDEKANKEVWEGHVYDPVGVGTKCVGPYVHANACQQRPQEVLSSQEVSLSSAAPGLAR